MSTKIICPRCKGNGKTGLYEDGIFLGLIQILTGLDECPTCDGKGYIYED